MNAAKLLFCLLAASLVVACSEKTEMELSKLHHEEDKFYFQEEPFTGKVVEYYDDAKKQLKQEGYLKDGKYEGEYKSYHRNGQLESHSYLVAGLEEGESIDYDEQHGLPIARLNYVGGKLNGAFLKYYFGGQQISEEGNYTDNLKQGLFKIYYENGALKAEIGYLNDREEGDALVYYPNGQLSVHAIMKNGIAEGAYIEYYESGAIKLKGAYVAGLEDGSFKWYFPKGQLAKESVIKTGEAIGTDKLYYENGTLQAQLHYSKIGDGKLLSQKWYDEKGKSMPTPEE